MLEFKWLTLMMICDADMHTCLDEAYDLKLKHCEVESVQPAIGYDKSFLVKFDCGIKVFEAMKTEDGESE